MPPERDAIRDNCKLIQSESYSHLETQCRLRNDYVAINRICHTLILIEHIDITSSRAPYTQPLTTNSNEFVTM